jgi:diaminopimelate decarboxylase
MNNVNRLVSNHFQIIDGELAVGAFKVSTLAEEYGTPLFAYDAQLMRRRLAQLRSSIPDRFDVFFSVKANPNPEVARIFVAEGTGLEIASAGEYLRARRAGCAAERILYAGPAKSNADLELVVAEGIGEIHVECHEEIDRLNQIARAAGVVVPTAVRVNPTSDASGGAMRMGGQPSQFGFDEEQVETAIERVDASSNLEFTGIHMFAGTQILDAAVLVNQWRHALGIGARASAVTGRAVSTIDLGGGLGISYFETENDLDMNLVATLSAELLEEIEQQGVLEGAHIILEPGRFLVGPAGVYVGRTLSVKTSRERTYVITDAGMHHHLAASGNLGQVIKRDYPVLNASRADVEPTMEASVVGPLCTPLDAIARKATLAHVHVGDLVAVLQSGAYGLSSSPVGFLSHPMPAEVLVDGDTHRCIRPRGTFEQPIVALP